MRGLAFADAGIRLPSFAGGEYYFRLLALRRAFARACFRILGPTCNQFLTVLRFSSILLRLPIARMVPRLASPCQVARAGRAVRLVLSRSYLRPHGLARGRALILQPRLSGSLHNGRYHLFDLLILFELRDLASIHPLEVADFRGFRTARGRLLSIVPGLCRRPARQAVFP